MTLDDFIAISDIHFNLQNNKIAPECLQRALDKCREFKVPLFIGGDLNDTKPILRAETVSSVIDLFTSYSDIHIFVLVGNHDLVNHNSVEHSLNFLKLLPNVIVIDEPSYIGRWLLVPYIHDKDKFKEELEDATKLGYKFVSCHQGVQGALMSEYAIDDSSVTIEIFSKFIQVFSGHYHRHQKVGSNFMYWGSPFTTRFDEAGQEKFIWRVTFSETANNFQTTPIPTGVRQHHQFEFENCIPPGLQKLGPKDLVKVVVRGEKSFVSSITKDKVKEIFGVESAVVVPMVTKKATYRLGVNSAMSPDLVIKSFLQAAATTLDKERLIQYFSKVTQ